MGKVSVGSFGLAVCRATFLEGWCLRKAESLFSSDGCGALNATRDR